MLWNEIEQFKVPECLHKTIARTLAVTSEGRQSSNEAFPRTILDQIIVSAVYEENSPREFSQPSSSSRENQAVAVLEVQHETFLQRPVTFEGDLRLLSGYADYTVRKQNQSTNLIIIIEAKKRNHTDTCLGQLTAYMGHNSCQYKGKPKKKKKKFDSLRRSFGWFGHFDSVAMIIGVKVFFWSGRMDDMQPIFSLSLDS